LIRYLALLYCLPLAALAAADGRTERGELKSVRDQRAALERQLKQSESSHAETADRLRDTEKAISAVGRKLRALSDERAATKAELAEHERDLKQLERQTAARQAQLARLLRYQFRPQEADALAVLLAGGDPNAAARDRHFLTLLSRAKADLIATLRRDAVETRRLADVVQHRNDKLAEIAQREEAEHASLRQRQQERQVVLANISNQIKAQRREIDTLKQDEQRLGKLIDSLAKRSATPAKAKSPPPEAARRGSASPPPPPSALAADPIHPGGAFAKLRGKLIPPVKGAIAGRFGARRDDGQSVWKGLFIRAAEGTDVRATAGGTVVFADWLRGYGNLVIIDHDDDFLSVYGNNQTILTDVGKKVGAGGTVATVGTGVGGGGSQPDSGLYFELRHQGRAFDPAKWLGPP
jgi:septal ring factor EnvC (AmiA/AmiB activator)